MLGDGERRLDLCSECLLLEFGRSGDLGGGDLGGGESLGGEDLGGDSFSLSRLLDPLGLLLRFFSELCGSFLAWLSARCAVCTGSRVCATRPLFRTSTFRSSLMIRFLRSVKVSREVRR